MPLRKIPKRAFTSCPGEVGDLVAWLGSPVVDGPHIAQFEDAFKNLLGVREAVSVSSARFAMILLLEHLGLKKGDGVILSAFNFRGVPEAILSAGLRPQFVDADRRTYQMDTGRLEEAIDVRTKAIIATHLFGQPCDLAEIMAIAKRHGLPVIEDAAHGLGSFYRGAHVGSIADAGFFSFSGSKPLSTSFGGMLTTNRLDLAERIRRDVKKYPFPGRKDLFVEMVKKQFYALACNRTFYTLTVYPVSLLFSLVGGDPIEICLNAGRTELPLKYMRFTDLQARVALKQMGLVRQAIERRRLAALRLVSRLNTSISIQNTPRDCRPNYFMLAFSAKDKGKVSKKLLFSGIDANLCDVCDCSSLVAEAPRNTASQHLSESILAIQLPFDLSEKEIDSVADTLNGVREWLN